MSTYGWIITKDFINQSDDDSDVGVAGPRDIPDALHTELKSGLGETFRMSDDDGEVYYEGRIVGEYDGLEPLDDFGDPNAGCVILEMKNGRTWQMI
jgi:hypothetical protein